MNKQDKLAAMDTVLPESELPKPVETKNAHYEKGDTIGGRYKIFQALSGGMGEVYLCYDTEWEEPFALKTFKAKFLTNPRVRELFEAEVNHWVKLEKHPNIVQCEFLKTVDNLPFMFLEWIAGDKAKGTSLHEWLAHGRLELRQAVEIIIDVCQGLIHAEQKRPGFVHRDLKPGNILMTPDGTAKITDFGLATVIQESGIGSQTPAIPMGGDDSYHHTISI
ncbi:serine/threonine-protein kinase, partial [Anaerolineales bacterium HSG24]|nr:serine/threonine-protein kinase [Anaerolineales bacterium HSG24]